MSSERLMGYIGQIDDSIIAEADLPLTMTKPSKYPWIRWIPLAAVAAVCLLVVIPLWLNWIQPNTPLQPSDLPKLTVNTELGAFGFEGYLAYDISELQNSNPWTEDNQLTTLPVFTNPNEYDRAGAPVDGLSPQEMLAEAEKIANLLGLEITSQNTSMYQVTAKCRGAEIEIQMDGHVLLTLAPERVHLAKEIGKLSDYNSLTISFEYGYEVIGEALYSRGMPLPDGYSFTYENTSNEQALEITQYLFSEYGSFMGITTAGYDLAAAYTYDGVLTRLHTFVFENAGSLTERILNYNFNRLYFAATELGELGAISYYKADLSQKVGDYPIITAAEARQLLLENHYITSVPEAFPGEEYIAHVELIYRTGRLDTVFMPYYKFWIEMPTMELKNGLKTFGVFYVPAVQSQYLENMPVWNGSFN
ncbi:MAG: hypothetical protein GX060_06775 [Firmicutes bacterium]|nr:hypothetical protein [Bacillota bacterium]